MATKFEDRHVLTKTSDHVIKMYTDQAFFERKYKALDGWDIEVLSCQKTDKQFSIRCKYSMKSSNPNIPAFAQKLMGDTVNITQLDTWDIAKKTGRLEVEIKGTPVKISADMTLKDEGKGSVNTLKWNINCSVPLIGGKIEGLIVSDIKAKSANDVAASNKILADY
ncbi:MAG: DUF2505 domain-containing protein [Rhizobium sp.]|nr:MAG: DUF2505 domain-containing protein [Rhizobium sp.]